MTPLLTLAHLLLALALFWHSANSPARNPVLRAMLYAFAFALMSFGAAGFLTLFDTDPADWRWMTLLGHIALIIFGVLWVGRETGRMAILKSHTEGHGS